jgi:hypothetical protein
MKTRAVGPFFLKKNCAQLGTPEDEVDNREPCLDCELSPKEAKYDLPLDQG